MDDLSKMLDDSCVGCYVDNVFVNSVFYADDLYWMAPCAIALQQLIYVVFHRNNASCVCSIAVKVLKGYTYVQ